MFAILSWKRHDARWWGKEALFYEVIWQGVSDSSHRVVAVCLTHESARAVMRLMEA